MEEVFRFIAIRPPQSRRTPALPAVTEHTPFQLRLLRSLEERRPLEAIVREAESFVVGDSFVADIGALETPVDRLLMAVREVRSRRHLDIAALRELVQAVFDQDARQIVMSQSYKEDRANLGDSVTALAVLHREGEQNYNSLVDALRLCGLLERVAIEDRTLDEDGAVHRGLSATISLPKRVFPLPSAINSVVAERERRNRLKQEAEQRRQDFEDRLTQFQALERAWDELNNLPAAALRRSAKPQFTVAPRVAPETSFWSTLRSLFGGQEPRREVTPVSMTLEYKPPSTLSDEAIAGLSQPTRAEVEGLGVDLEAIPLPQALQRIEQALSQHFQQLVPASGPTNVRRLGTRMFAERRAQWPPLQAALHRDSEVGKGSADE